MFDLLIRRLTGTATDSPEDREDAVRTAIAAILVEAARADAIYRESERETIDRILADRFALDPDEAASIRREGEAAQAEAMDIVRFTRVLKEAIPLEERVGIIEAVWRVVLADDEGEMNETNLVRRLCGLLYVDDRDSGLARKRVLNGG